MAKKKRKEYGLFNLLNATAIAAGSLALLWIVMSFVAKAMGGWWAGAIWQALAVLFFAALGLLVFLSARLLLASYREQQHGVSHLERIESLLEQQGNAIRELVGLTTLSDQAKSLIYYEREVDALRESVNALLLKQDPQGAEALIQRMESRLGLVEEAARLRREIDRARNATADEKIMGAINRVREILERRHWSRGKREIERLMAMFPNSPLVGGLSEELRQAWSGYKRKLLKEYGEAVRVNDVERSIELLKELDKYLTAQEGAALEESARDVFKKKLHNLGVQFAIAVADQNWSFAVATGEEIVGEYPNSRMAREVREKLDLLRDYAAGRRQPSPSILDQPDSPFGEGSPTQPPPPTDG